MILQDKVYDEIIACVGDTKKEDIDQTGLNKLIYLDQVIKETMRLFPPFPVYSRRLTNDTKLSKWDVVKKTSISNDIERKTITQGNEDTGRYDDLKQSIIN